MLCIARFSPYLRMLLQPLCHFLCQTFLAQLAQRRGPWHQVTSTCSVRGRADDWPSKQQNKLGPHKEHSSRTCTGTTIRGNVFFAHLDVVPPPGTYTSLPPPSAWPSPPPRNGTAPPWHGAQDRRAGHRWKPSYGERAQKKPPATQGASWESGKTGGNQKSMPFFCLSVYTRRGSQAKPSLGTWNCPPKK